MILSTTAKLTRPSRSCEHREAPREFQSWDEVETITAAFQKLVFDWQDKNVEYEATIKELQEQINMLSIDPNLDTGAQSSGDQTKLHDQIKELQDKVKQLQSDGARTQAEADAARARSELDPDETEDIPPSSFCRT